jgi:Leucine-rich repeat (LRR) protein
MNAPIRTTSAIILMAGLLTIPTSSQEPKSSIAKEPPADVLAAWQKAGASYEAGELPAFDFFYRPRKPFPELPAMDVPFALSLGDWVTDAELRGLARFTQLRRLNLWGAAKITNAGVKEVGRIRELEKLDLSHTKITDTGLNHLAALTQMRSLDLRGTEITDTGLRELSRLKRLEALELGSTNITDAGLKELAGLKQLQSLSLHDTKITGAGFKELAGLRQFRRLNLGGSKVTNAGLKELGGLADCERWSCGRPRFPTLG